MSQSLHSIRTLGVLLFPEFETLDVFGPLEVFGMVPDKIKVMMLSEEQGLVKSAQGQSIWVDSSCNDAPKLDILLIPGGIGTRREVNNPALIHWIKDRATKAELTLSVCTGAALLAKAGVLHGRKATTNKLAFNWVAQQDPNVNWIKKARWVDDGSVVTSSGISAGIDMSLYIISRLFGSSLRDELAKKAEYIMNTDSSFDPFML